MTKFNSKALLVAATFLIVAISASAQTQKNYQNALLNGLEVLTTSNGYADLNKEYMKKKQIGENQIERHITPQYASFFDLTANKYFASEVLKSGEAVTRLNQARRGKETHYDYETAVIASDGSIDSYTVCDVDPAKSTESICQTVNAFACSEFQKNKLDEAQLNRDIENCSNLEKRLDTLKVVVSNGDLQKANDANIAAMNQSSVKKYIFGDASVSRKKIDDVPVAKQNNLQLITDIASMNKACTRLRSKGFIAEVAAAAEPAPAASAAKEAPKAE